MTILLIFLALSLICTVLLVSATMLSSRMNQRQAWDESYDEGNRGAGITDAVGEAAPYGTE